MGFLGKSFLRGLATIVPLAVTVYVFWWVVSGAEASMRWLIPPSVYHPGLGIAVGVVVTVIVGALLNYWLVRRLYEYGISIFERLPLVKTIYRMLNDMVGFFAQSEDRKSHQVVMVRVVPDGPEMLGFVTRPDTTALPAGVGGPEQVGVFLPMSYQMGGFLVFVPRSHVRAVDMEMEEALRFALSAGLTTHVEAGPPRPNEVPRVGS